MKLQTSIHENHRWSEDLAAELDSPSTLIFAFGATRHGDEPGPLDEVRSRFPRSHLLGCSTAGEIHGAKVVDDSLTVAIARFEQSRLRVAKAPIGPGGSLFEAGRSIARELAEPDLRAVFVVSDGKGVNGSDLVRGLNSVLPQRVVVTGGLAGDGARFARTWVLVDGHPQAGYVVAVGLYGDAVHVGHGSKGGWDIFGPERTVTRSEGNVLHELDGRPALQLYKEYLGDLVAGLPATALLFPLAIREPGSERRLVRTILDIVEKDQSMVFAGDIPTGCHAQLMRANFERLVQGASDAASMISMPGARGPILSVAVSCVGRRLVLRQRTDEELEATLDVLPPGTQQVGFYSYGELSPHASGSCELHNQTMTLTTVGEW
jgi:hypothetical protein